LWRRLRPKQGCGAKERKKERKERKKGKKERRKNTFIVITTSKKAEVA
jgi:hypothetical protein